MKLAVLYFILAALFAWLADNGYTADQVEWQYNFNSPVAAPGPRPQPPAPPPSAPGWEGNVPGGGVIDP